MLNKDIPELMDLIIEYLEKNGLEYSVNDALGENNPIITIKNGDEHVFISINYYSELTQLDLAEIDFEPITYEPTTADPFNDDWLNKQTKGDTNDKSDI